MAENENVITEMCGISKERIVEVFQDKSKSSLFQRLETLGDKILGFIVMKELYKNPHGLSEKQLGMFESLATRNSTLSSIFQSIGLGEFLGYKIEINCTEPKKYADMVEALVALIHEEVGLEQAIKFVKTLLFPHMERIIRIEIQSLPDGPIIPKTIPSEAKVILITKKQGKEKPPIKKVTNSKGFLNRRSLARV